MSTYAANLGRAARLLDRFSDIGGLTEFEGVALRDIVSDVQQAQNRAFMEIAVDTFSKRVDDSKVIDLHDFVSNRKESA